MVLLKRNHREHGPNPHLDVRWSTGERISRSISRAGADEAIPGDGVMDFALW
jgi:hypothetical protein